MTGVPTVTVKLDDGTGTYPIDITSAVRMTEGITVSGYGRSDEAPGGQAASLSLTLDNIDGAFTVGTGFGFGLGGFGLGGFGGVAGGALLSPSQGIRYTATVGATTRTRFTGRIATAVQQWPTGDSTLSTVAITAVDPLADAARRTLRSMLEQEILLRSPSAYYTLGEAEGSTSAGDSSGSQAPSLTMAGTGAAVTFGSGTGPGVDGLTAATFAGGQYLVGTVPTLSSSWSAAFFFATTAVPTGFGMPLLDLGVIAPLIDSSGVLLGHTVNDGSTHMLVLSNSGSSLKIYLDGALVSSGGALSVPTTFKVGAGGGLPAVYVGTMSHVAVSPSALSAGDVAAIYGASLGITETTAARFARIASYGGFTTATTSGMSGQLMGAQATSGKSLADALQDVGTAEGGVVYANGTGLVTLQGRNYRSQKVAADQTLAAIDVGEDTSLTLDTQQMVNKVTVSRPDGATQIAQDNVSIAARGEFPTSLDLPVDTDANALLAAQWVLAKHAIPGPRLPSVTFDLMTSSVAEQIFAREVGDRIAFSGMPSQQWASAGDATLEGWTETLQVSLSSAEWTLAATLLPWSLASAFILDSATLGVLDGSTPIGY